MPNIHMRLCHWHRSAEDVQRGDEAGRKARVHHGMTVRAGCTCTSTFLPETCMLNRSKAGRVPLFARPLLSKVAGVTRALQWKEVAMVAYA